MTRWIRCAAACGALALCLAGCGMKDGVYTAEFAHFDSLGYKDRLQITVEEGVITGADFDAVDGDGGLKSEDQVYAARMAPLCGVSPAQISEYYQQALVGLEKPKELEADAISGATVSARRFEALWQALQTPISKGDTAPVTVADIPEFAADAAESGQGE